MATNIVRVREDGLIVVIESGYQTRETIRSLNQQVERAVKRALAQGRPALVLADLRLVTGHDRGAELEAVRTLRIPFNAMAVHSPSKADRVLINMLVMINHARERVRTFKDMREALRWLQNVKIDTKANV